MILTVTLNTALDITYRVRALRPHASHRVSEVTERPGGKGLNVARVLAALGHEVTVTGFAGGATGRVVQEQLAATPGVVDALVPVAGATRRTIAVVDERTGDTTQLNEPGPHVAPAEWSAFQDAYEDLLPVRLRGGPVRQPAAGRAGGRVRRSGAARAQVAGVPVLLDTSGEPLRRGVAARPGHHQAERRRTGRAHRLARAARGPPRTPAAAGRACGGRLAGRGGAARRDPRGPLAGRPARAACAATRPARATRRSRACCRGWWSGCPGRTGWPARPRCPRRPCWHRWRASSTGRRTRSWSGAGGGDAEEVAAA